MTSAEIRQAFLDFFKSKGHTIVPSSSLMPDSPNLLFTNAGMNQFVPIFLSQRAADVSKWPGAIPGKDTRAADTQKCIRAGGKHNDLEDVGLDTYHHTFFEMLGNWSFGDYFKKEAIEWAWELITGVYKFPKSRLYATVYSSDKKQGDPSEFDQEAYDIWAATFRSAGLDPKVHIVHGGKKDNFWMMGETGPCGPCSEIHVDLTPQGDTKGRLVNQGSAECIEIWNLVFIQFNANADGSFSPLPAKHVDTGMGFERLTSFIQCTRNFTDFSQVISNYETDVFRSLFNHLEKLSGKKYRSTLPAAGSSGQSEQEKIDIAFRVIGDHIRTLSFAIADGIQPGNTDRSYVLRRILRRAVRYGRSLGFREPFFYKLVSVLADTMGHVFPEIRGKQENVEEVIHREEEAFSKTLDNGIKRFNEICAALLASSLTAPGEFVKGVTSAISFLENHDEQDFEKLVKAAKSQMPDWTPALMRPISGEDAFKLYDTYGFPVDLTQLMARERGLRVDVQGFAVLMEKQRALGRAAQKKTVISLSEIGDVQTKFVGYDSLSSDCRVVSSFRAPEGVFVAVNVSPFYAQMGGQVGDAGTLTLDSGHTVFKVVDTLKQGQAHLLKLADTDEDLWLAVDEAPVAHLAVDSERRFSIQRHHTVTHLLHWALHEVVSKDAVQKGSYVGPDKLTFDFSSAPLTTDQIAKIEKLVNERILENAHVSWTEVKYDDIKSRKEVMQFFGEKYGDMVRVVQIGGQKDHLDGYSMELCGGTHTRATGEIGLFRIVAESAIAAGIRRIEAISGLEAYHRANSELQLIKNVAGKVSSPIGELEKKIESLLTQQRELEKQLKAANQKQAAETARGLVAKAQTIGANRVIIENLGIVDGDFLQSIADALKGQFRGVVVLGGTTNGAVTLLATVSSDLTKQIQAGKIIQTIAPIVGGKGGGKPDNARGGGKDVSKLDEALAQARKLII